MISPSGSLPLCSSDNQPANFPQLAIHSLTSTSEYWADGMPRQAQFGINSIIAIEEIMPNETKRAHPRLFASASLMRRLADDFEDAS
jgi:hypothetical protein